MAIIDLKYGERYEECLKAQKELISQISKKVKIPGTNITLTNGTDSAIIRLLSFNKKNQSILFDTPNYFFFLEKVEAWGFKKIAIPRDKNLEYPAKKIIEYIKKKKPDIIYLSSPNNPTGKAIPQKDLLEIIRNTPDKTLIIVDRTVVNIKQETPTSTLLKMFKMKDLVICHSFSKSHHLAHLRIGFIVSTKKRIMKSLIDQGEQAFNLNSVLNAIKVVNNKELEKKEKELITYCWNKIKKAGLENYGISIIKSDGNFLMLRLPKKKNVYKICQSLIKEGIEIMPMVISSHHYIRLNVGRGTQNKREILTFICILKGLLRK